MSADMALEAALEVIRTFNSLRIDYLVGGSLASSIHGTPRSTNDVDLVADLKLVHAPMLELALKPSFYIDINRVRVAVREKSSFNIIFLKTMFKVDVFILKDDPLSREEMRRRQRITVGQHQEEAIDVASPEDTILQKLAWYQLGGSTSDRQWDDLLGILKIRRDIDWEYLARWSTHLDVHELYLKALRDAGRGVAPSRK